LLDGVDDFVHFVIRAFHDEFDAAVGEIADVALDAVGRRCS
jgi:hypothetical protein